MLRFKDTKMSWLCSQLLHVGPWMGLGCPQYICYKYRQGQIIYILIVNLYLSKYHKYAQEPVGNCNYITIMW